MRSLTIQKRYNNNNNTVLSISVLEVKGTKINLIQFYIYKQVQTTTTTTTFELFKCSCIYVTRQKL